MKHNKYLYKTISLRSITGINEAEKLQAEGWNVVNVGFNSVTLSKKL